MGHRCFERSVAMKRVHTKADRLFADKEDPKEQKGSCAYGH